MNEFPENIVFAEHEGKHAFKDVREGSAVYTSEKFDSRERAERAAREYLGQPATMAPAEESAPAPVAEASSPEAGQPEQAPATAPEAPVADAPVVAGPKKFRVLKPWGENVEGDIVELENADPAVDTIGDLIAEGTIEPVVEEAPQA